MIRVIVVDDHAERRLRLRTILTPADDMEVIGEATDGGQALALVAALQPDVVLMAVQLPTVNGIAATRHIHTLDQSITIILFAPVLYDDDAEAAQRGSHTVHAGGCSTSGDSSGYSCDESGRLIQHKQQPRRMFSYNRKST